VDESIRKWLFDPTVGKLVTIALGLLAIHLIVRLVKRSLGRHLKDNDTRYHGRKFVEIIGRVASVVFIAVIFSDKLGGLTVALGVAGAGIAFALQEVIASVAGWFAVSFSHFYGTGDRVQLGGIKGDVIDIGILRTTLMECGQWVDGDLYNGRVVRIANAFVFKEPVFNYSREFPFLWDEIKVPIKYGCEHRLAREILERVANEVVGDYAPGAKAAWQNLVAQFRIEDARVEPMITMIANDNWIEFTVRYVVEYRSRRITKDKLFTRILDEIDKTDGRVAMASATFQLVGAPVIDVRTNR
jgi:small-conductance mechanosensitive channel